MRALGSVFIFLLIGFPTFIWDVTHAQSVDYSKRLLRDFTDSFTGMDFYCMPWVPFSIMQHFQSSSNAHVCHFLLQRSPFRLNSLQNVLAEKVNSKLRVDVQRTNFFSYRVSCIQHCGSIISNRDSCFVQLQNSLSWKDLNKITQFQPNCHGLGHLPLDHVCVCVSVTKSLVQSCFYVLMFNPLGKIRNSKIVKI